jgi:hypothetical protein
MSRQRLGLAVCACALLLLPSAASASAGQRGFDQTFPDAARLCTKFARGRGPVKLRGDATQVAARCATLQTAFTNAQSAYFSTVTPLRQQVIAVNAKTHEACALRPSATCTTTRRADRVTIKGLRAQVRAAATTYRNAIKAARATFWTAIRALPGGASITPDTGTPVAPTVTLPAPL